MITVPVIQAFMLGVLRLAAMGAALYLYRDAHGDAGTLAAAAGLAFFAMTGQAIDVLRVAKQVADASTTTSVTLQQPADTPSPMQLAAKTEPAPPS
jgi:uncharacterized iron-regulated membrane protein